MTNVAPQEQQPEAVPEAAVPEVVEQPNSQESMPIESSDQSYEGHSMNAPIFL